MAGIVSYGAYIPLWRLARDAIAEAWGSGSIRGERSVANNDEDTITWYITDFRWSPQAAAVAVLGRELGYP
jgi:3-hydroxy-3-methylglutaryl CoA synthase